MSPRARVRRGGRFRLGFAQALLRNAEVKLVFVILLMCGFAWASLALAVEVFPLEELRPGMRGKTLTVLQGTEVSEMETEIVGVIEDRLAPGKHLIVGRLLDERVQLSGAVHGMSGSPLLIEGKLVGALSRRLGLFEKDTQCGFTPAADMLQVWGMMARDAAGEDEGMPTAVAAGDETLLLLPVASGLPEGPRLEFARWMFRGTGLLLQAGGGVAPGKDLPGAPLVPGAPVAAALATGDLGMAGTGTLTWREGDRVLAFGHPMLGLGSTTLPLCEAEIVTIIPSYMMPYKISNTRRQVGLVREDRLSAIAGVVGEMGELPSYDITVAFNGVESRFRGNYFDHRNMSPMLTATLMLRALSAREDLPAEMTFRTEGSVGFSGGARREFRFRHSGSGGEEALLSFLVDYLFNMQTLLRQNFERVKTTGLRGRVEVQKGSDVLTLRRISTQPVRPTSGNAFTAEVRLSDEQGGAVVKRVELKLPNFFPAGEEITLRALSARALEMERRGVEEVEVGGMVLRRISPPRNSATLPQSFEELLSVLNRVADAEELVVLALRRGRALKLGVEQLEGLPLSVQSIVAADRRAETLQEQVVGEVRLPIGRVLAGEARTTFRVADGWLSLQDSPVEQER